MVVFVQMSTASITTTTTTTTNALVLQIIHYYSFCIYHTIHLNVNES